jgi:hypothetical protein
MRAFCLLAFIVLSGPVLFAQPAAFVVRSGVDPASVLPVHYRYLNDEYLPGYLSLPTGKKSNAKFNYDLLFNLLMFINETNDTLSIAASDDIKNVHIGSEDFYHVGQKGYFKILASDTISSLVSQVRLEEVRHKMNGNDGFGGTDTGSLYSLRTGNSAIGNTRNVDVSFERITEHFLINQDGAITKANRSGFLEMFPGLEKSLKPYLKKENIDFNKEEDILKLFKYCLSFMEGN